MTPKKQYNLKLNSVNKIEELLQELYNETNKMVNEIQEQMNRLSSSVNLNRESLDSKAKYAKSMNDFIANKEKAIARKLDIAKLMSEVLKYNGNMKQAIQESNMDWDSFRNELYADGGENNEEKKEVEVYTLKRQK